MKTFHSTGVTRSSRVTTAALLITALICASISASAQVSGIKSASSSKGSGGREGGGGSISTGAAYMFVDFAFRGLAAWQINTLQHRGEVPNILSLEVFGQVAVQPSTYYVFNPRIRGNWGIFMTDFRMNYMLEEKIGAPQDLRTDDWQILGLNFINTRNVTARLSTGIMHEAFGEGNIFNESVLGLSIMNDNQSFGGMTEFRLVKDYSVITIPRFEGSIGVQKKLVDRGRMHLFLTGGAMFQRYYNKINVWGMQGGLAFKLY